MGDENKPVDGERAREFLKTFRRGVQFTEELMTENERLRARVLELESSPQRLGSEGEAGYRHHAVEEENLEYQSRYAEIESDYNRISNLYVASYQLHSDLDFDVVIQLTFDILLNLVGADEFALYVLDAQRLVPIRARGVSIGDLPSLALGKGPAGEALAEASLFVTEGELDQGRPDCPLVCIPLTIGKSLLGMVAIFRFLRQKSCLTELDGEIFRLLGTHAATALYSACLERLARASLAQVASEMRRSASQEGTDR
ncbi:MAG: GAF domain-containing protein [Deltaproteobacteria bacterium]|nr:GAF domain-containing protein [Deltaproteobacteria bacterium]